MTELPAGTGTVEDQISLKRHIDTYHWLADNYRWDDWAALLSADTVFEVASAGRTYRGHEEAFARLRAGIEDRYKATQHTIVNTYFEVHGDSEASGHGNLIFVGVFDPSQPAVNYLSGGRYEWRFRRSDSVTGWHTTYTKLRFVWELNEASASNFFSG